MDNLELVFWDVQHGNATYIKTPQGQYIVIDLGVGSYGEDEEFSPLLYLKNKYKVKQLDAVVFTHPHKDHIGDIMNFDGLLPRVVRRPVGLKKDEVMVDVKKEDEALFEKYFEIDKKYNAPVPDEVNPFLPTNNGGVDIRTFYPTVSDSSDINNRSLVTIISYATTKIIIPGDNESVSWKELLEKDEFNKARNNVSILLASHHGRESGFYSDLFKESTDKPYLTIVSDGRFCDTSATNRYSAISIGWTIHHRDGRADEKRKCVTTRSDGVIVVKVGYNVEGEKEPFRDIRIN